jgi:hypothetical protein
MALGTPRQPLTPSSVCLEPRGVLAGWRLPLDQPRVAACLAALDLIELHKLAP